MVHYSDSIEDINNLFSTLGIPTNNPGFYDHQEFIAQESKDPEFLNFYGKFVLSKHYNQAYLKSAESIIKKVASILHEELVEDGRLGACIDLSMVLSRILDKLGVWNFMVKGALTTIYPNGSNLPNSYYWPRDLGPSKAGHVWVSAPPFSVVDITIGQQPYKPIAKQYFPDKILSKTFDRVKVGVEDICSSDFRDQMQLQGIPLNDIGLYTVSPNLKGFFLVFKQTAFRYRGAEHRYIPCGVSFSDSPLEKITSLKLNGKYGHEIYHEIIRSEFQPLNDNLGSENASQ
jgi:hypothetical protein